MLPDCIQVTSYHNKKRIWSFVGLLTYRFESANLNKSKPLHLRNCWLIYTLLK